MWFWYAVGAAVFAALTSILAKIGIEGVNSTLAIYPYSGGAGHGVGDGVRYRKTGRYHLDFREELAVFGAIRTGDRSVMALLLSCLADWRSEEGRSHR